MVHVPYSRGADGTLGGRLLVGGTQPRRENPMVIDKARFLTLVGVIAAGGCSSSSGGGDGASPPGDTADAAGGCEDSDAAAPVACPFVESSLPPCLGLGFHNTVLCDGVSANLKPAIASKVNACLSSTITTDPDAGSCAGTAEVCVQDALANSCLTSEGTAACKQIFDSCTAAGSPPTGAGSSSAAECAAYASGLSDTGRVGFVACAQSGGTHACNLHDCYASLIGL